MVQSIAFYGLLMRQGGAQQRLGVDRALTFISPCRIPGRLVDLGSYPGLVEEPGEVEGELYRLDDPAVLATLDDFEGYDRDRPAGSPYVRRRRRLIAPDVEASVYVYTGPLEGRARIASGAWFRRDSAKR